MKNTLIVLSIVLTLGLGVYAQHSHGSKGANKDVTVTGEVIDPVCYISHDSQGKEHKPCAEYCVQQGIPLAILEDKTGKIYISLPVDHTNPNAKLKDFIADKVKATGTVFSKGGLTGIHVKSVQKAGT
jgi:type 1 fimbria pilin